MKAKLVPIKPVLIVLYGFPGSGKTTFAKQFVDEVSAVHVQADKIAADLLGNQTGPHKSKLAHYMTREFITSGVSVIYDGSTARLSERGALQKLAREAKVQYLSVWIQLDQVTAYARTQTRDRRKSEDKYAKPYTQESFAAALAAQQNPKDEQYTVISGKHAFKTQRSAVIKKLYDLSIINPDQVSQGSTVMPGMVNLVPPSLSSGRVDMSRRNIRIR